MTELLDADDRDRLRTTLEAACEADDKGDEETSRAMLRQLQGMLDAVLEEGENP